MAASIRACVSISGSILAVCVSSGGALGMLGGGPFGTAGISAGQLAGLPPPAASPASPSLFCFFAVLLPPPFRAESCPFVYKSSNGERGK